MRTHYLTLALVLISCGPKTLGGLPGDSESTSLDTDETLAVDTTIDDQTTGADEATAIDLTTTAETTTIDTTTGTGGALHPACELPFPEPTPALPDVRVDDDDRPRFDEWTKIACDDVAALPTCGAEGDPSCTGMCLEGVAGEVGVCGFSDIDIWCDGEGEAINYQGYGCWVCVQPTLHAQACCAGLPGFDCRTWPYPADGPQGSVCAVHEDCEPGLVCGAHKGSGYGICQCPGLDPVTVVPPQSCF